jgi:hypothetical protein
MKAFERAVLIEATRLRELFKKTDQPDLYLKVEISGPVDYDNLRITFRVGTNEYSSDSVEAETVDASLDEFFRRKGWKAQHDALCLPHLDSHRED